MEYTVMFKSFQEETLFIAAEVRDGIPKAIPGMNWRKNYQEAYRDLEQYKAHEEMMRTLQEINDMFDEWEQFND